MVSNIDRYDFEHVISPTPQVIPSAYKALLKCVESGDINVCEEVPSGIETGASKLINPIGATGHQVEGADR